MISCAWLWALVPRTGVLLALAVGAATAAQLPAPNHLIIDDALLRKVLPEAKAPRLMRLEDLPDNHERLFFAADGLTFVLLGDFDKDGVVDYAVAGKDDGLDPGASAFLVILTVQKEQPVVRHFEHLRMPRVSLTLRSNCRRGFDAIDLVYTPRSDHGSYRVWDGTKYTRIKICDDK